MPVTTSAIKKARQDKKSRKRNRIIKDDYKKAVKSYKALVKAKDKKGAAEALKVVFSKIDIAAKKKIIHKNNAARKKSRLTKIDH